MLEPNPAADETALRWYRAVAAFMANRSDFAELQIHLLKGRSVFPDDPGILFVSGCLYEAFASPRVRTLADSSTLPGSVSVDVPSARESWEQAESYFSRASELRPDDAEARLRRGRVLHMLGRHQAARLELAEAARRTNDREILYLAALFDGSALEALDDEEGAVAAYERAASLFSGAQSPWLALSRLARQRGDRSGALAYSAQLLARPVRDELDDPWWVYHLRHVREERELLASLRAPFLETDR